MFTTSHPLFPIAESLGKRLKVTSAVAFEGEAELRVEGTITRNIRLKSGDRVQRVARWRLRLIPGDGIRAEIGVKVESQNHLSNPVLSTEWGSNRRCLVRDIARAIEASAMECALNSRKVSYHREIVKREGPLLSESAA